MGSHTESLGKGNGAYMHNSMSEHGAQGLAWGWHSSQSNLLAASGHETGSNGFTRNGHSSAGGHKRHRGLDGSAAPVQAGPHHDALMELARENLLLKHQLHVATTEVDFPHFARSG